MGLCMGTGPGETVAEATCREPWGPSSAPHSQWVENNPKWDTLVTTAQGTASPARKDTGAGGVHAVCNRDIASLPAHVCGSPSAAPLPLHPNCMSHRPLHPVTAPGDDGTLVHAKDPRRASCLQCNERGFVHLASTVAAPKASSLHAGASTAFGNVTSPAVAVTLRVAAGRACVLLPAQRLARRTAPVAWHPSCLPTAHPTPLPRTGTGLRRCRQTDMRARMQTPVTAAPSPGVRVWAAPARTRTW